MLKNKAMYTQFIRSVAFVNEELCTCLRPLYLYFPDMPRNSRSLKIQIGLDWLRIRFNCGIL